jgi:AcrR family transcriptional regulator
MCVKKDFCDERSEYRMEKIQPTTRQKILDHAGELFFRLGYRAVGIDTIVKATGMAKMTLYRHFPSKDDLIVAFLEQTDGALQAWLDEAIQPEVGRPRAQLLAVFDALQKLVASPQCHGCAFLMVSAEFPELGSPGHQVALAHKQSVRRRFAALAAQAGARQPEQLADQLLLLMDGAFSAARMFGTENPGANVAQAAKVLMDAQIQPPYPAD